MNNEWITDRKPTRDDGVTVYDRNGSVCQFFCIAMGDPWKPIPQIEPYVKPKRYWVEQRGLSYVVINVSGVVASCIPTREAAEEIAAIYERTLP